MTSQSETQNATGLTRIWPLTFDDSELEAEFRNSYWPGALPYARFAMLSAAFLGAAFGVLDRLVAEYAISQLFVIRFGLMVPVILIGFGLSFITWFKKRYHVVVMFNALVVGGSIIVMIAILKPPASDYYYAGLIMVLFFTYTFLQLRLFHAAISALLLFAGYEIVAIVFNSSPTEAVVNNTVFLIAANYGGMFACYSIERIRRDNFLNVHVITEERKELSKTKRKLEKISTRDDLTNLYNRRHLNNSINDFLSEFSPDSMPIAVMMIDLDNFKRVNDVYGHGTGDDVLKMVANTLLRCAKSTDLVFRLGGDEFMILQPGESAISGTNTALRILTQFKDWAQGSIIARSSKLGMSIGLTEFFSPEDTLGVLMKHADQSLYRAKRLGKGRIVAVPRRQPSDDETSGVSDNETGSARTTRKD